MNVPSLQHDSNMLSLAGKPTPWPAFGKSCQVSVKLGAESCLDSVRSWIKTCDTHRDCTSTRITKLPRRVLDLRLHRLRNAISLLETKEDDVGTYMTLSHSWGGKQSMKTTKDTLSERKVAIRISALPQTFRDAVIIARGLGINFLWIDSLCIIQGDRLDWEQESAKMAAIYEGSYLNIAATHANSSTGGCFSNRWTNADINGSTYKVGVKSYLLQERHDGQDFSLYVRLSLEPGHQDLGIEESRLLTRKRAPLLTRAWVFQERCLACRTLHFHSQELIWECKMGLMCECKDLNVRYQKNSWHQGWKAKHLSWKAGDLEDLPNLWLAVVVGFSKLSLTHETDRLPALSGMASRFCGSLLKTYLAGVWKEDIARALLWYVGPHWKSTSSRPLPLRAPTWSWASLDLIKQVDFIMYPFLMSDKIVFHQNPVFRLIDAQCCSSSINPYGEVSDGVLAIECSYNSAIFSKRDARAINDSLILDCNVVEEEDLVVVTIQTMHPDVALDRLISDELLDFTIVYCLFIGSEPRDFEAERKLNAYCPPETPKAPEDTVLATDYGIVVKESSSWDGCYERIGFLRQLHWGTEDYNNWFHNTIDGVFKIR